MQREKKMKEPQKVVRRDKKKPLTKKHGINKKLNHKKPMAKAIYEKKFTVPLKKKRRNDYNPKEEARLERIVFGDPTDILDNISDDEAEPILGKEKIVIDDNKAAENSKDEHSETSDTELNVAELTDVRKPVWVDEDDSEYTVNTAFEAQNRKLQPRDKPERAYTELLQTKYKQLVGTPKWAEFDRPQDNESDELDNEILKHSCHLEKPVIRNLPKSIIDIKALTPINKQTHIEGPIVSTLEFHPSSTAAIAAGSSGNLSVFQIDGIENNKLHTMLYKKFPISKATFLKDGNEILVGSAYYAHCHSYDLISGKTHRIPLPHGITNMKRYEVSPDGTLIALCGKFGEIYLLSSSTKELISTLKMNTKCRTVAFSPNSKLLYTHGDGNEIYVWDVNSRTCIHRAIDDGCLSCESIAMSPSGQFMATGSKEGVVNLYDTKKVLESQTPVPLKIILNLVTSITALKFNPTSEILAMASNKKPNAFKMVHIPSFEVFSNFPTFQTKISMPEIIDFSPGSGYMGLSNRSGSAFLYRLKHYGNY